MSRPRSPQDAAPAASHDAAGRGQPAGPSRTGAAQAWPPTVQALRDAASTVVSIVLVAAAFGWALGLHRMMRLALYTEQFLAFALGAALAIVFLRLSRSWLAFPLALAALAAGSHVALGYADLSLEAAIDPSTVRATALSLLVLLGLGLFLVAGVVLTLVVGAFILYGFLGDQVPGTFRALPVEPDRLVAQLAFDTSGVLGTPLSIAATVVVVFVAFGLLLQRFGGAAVLTDLAARLMGAFRGGAAKIAILASSLFGAISGSAVSNVATTGVVTIPMMRRSGFPSPAAAGIEAVASTGGQLVPPVMGASAFLMAEFLEIPYAEVALAALLPALLYYLALFLQADLRAARLGISGVNARDAAAAAAGAGPEDAREGSARRARPRGLPFLLPFAVLIGALFFLNYQPATAGMAAIAALLAAGPLAARSLRPLSPVRLASALSAAGRASAAIVVITAAAGIVIGVLNETGLGFSLTNTLTDLAGGNSLVVLLAAAAISLVLGMGMPTIAVYVLLAALVAPSLVAAGIEPVPAHLFVLYFGMMSMITPPVALAAFAAASLAGCGPMRAAFEAMRFGWPAYVVPFLFALNPALALAGGAGPWATAAAFAGSAIGVAAVTAALTGWLRGALGPLGRLAAATAGATCLAATALAGWLTG